MGVIVTTLPLMVRVAGTATPPLLSTTDVAVTVAGLMFSEKVMAIGASMDTSEADLAGVMLAMLSVGITVSVADPLFPSDDAEMTDAPGLNAVTAPTASNFRFSGPKGTTGAATSLTKISDIDLRVMVPSGCVTGPLRWTIYDGDGQTVTFNNFTPS